MNISHKFLKRTAIVFLFTIVGVLSQAQEYPIEDTPDDMPHNSYAKDINGLLNPYIGTWQGTYSHFSMTITFEKIKKKYGIETEYYYKDILVGKYKVTDTDTGLVADDATLPYINVADLKLRGAGFPVNGSYSLVYFGNGSCEVDADIEIKTISGNPNQLLWDSLNIMPNDGLDECTGIYHYYLPVTDITLTKQ